MVDDLLSEETNVEAVLMPANQSVKMANCVIVVTKKFLTHNDVLYYTESARISLEFLHSYQKRFIYSITIDDVAAVLTLHKHTPVLYSQPDLLPVRERPTRPVRFGNILNVNADTFDTGTSLSHSGLKKSLRYVCSALGHPIYYAHSLRPSNTTLKYQQ